MTEAKAQQIYAVTLNGVGIIDGTICRLRKCDTHVALAYNAIEEALAQTEQP